MELESILSKVRDEESWTSYVVARKDDPAKVLGGCVVKEHCCEGQSFAELFLLAVSSSYQKQGLGRRIVEHLKEKHQMIATYSDLKTTGFYARLGFREVSDQHPQRAGILACI